MSGYDIITDELAEMSGMYPTERFDRNGADCPEVGEDWSSVADGDGMSLFVGNMVKVGIEANMPEMSGWYEVVRIGTTCTIESVTGHLTEVRASCLFQM